ncbi:MAG: hypothetical protein AB1750_15745, partial [Chloroflexota bacterium]
MKQLCLILTAFGIVLTACGAPVNSTELPTATLISQPTATATNTLTPTPEPTATLEVVSLPANFMDNPLYAAEIEKHDWSYNSKKNQIWVNWKGTGKQED